MAKETRYNINIGSPASITDELYNSVGAGENILGDQKRAFRGSTLVIRTASGGGGTLLVETTDYDLVNEDTALTADAGFEVYTGYQVTNAAFQAVDLYFSYDVIGTYTDADIINEVSQVGFIYSHGNNSTPTGYLACDGSAISRTTYRELFDEIGTTWGVGDGSTTFNVPDLRGVYTRGTGSHGSLNMADGNDFAGPAVGASENDQFQGHYHNFKASEDAAAGTARECVNGQSIDPWPRVFEPITDGTNGAVRSGDETKPVSFGIKYVIKY